MPLRGEDRRNRAFVKIKRLQVDACSGMSFQRKLWRYAGPELNQNQMQSFFPECQKMARRSSSTGAKITFASAANE